MHFYMVFVHFWGATCATFRDSERSDQQNPGHDGLRERELHHAQCSKNDASYQATGQQGHGWHWVNQNHWSLSVWQSSGLMLYDMCTVYV